MNCIYRFYRNTEMLNFIKIRPVGAELFHADRKTDGEKDGRIWRKYPSLFAILRSHIKTPLCNTFHFLPSPHTTTHHNGNCSTHHHISLCLPHTATHNNSNCSTHHHISLHLPTLQHTITVTAAHTTTSQLSVPELEQQYDKLQRHSRTICSAVGTI